MTIVRDVVNRDGIGRNKPAENLPTFHSKYCAHRCLSFHLFSNEKLFSIFKKIGNTFL